LLAAVMTAAFFTLQHLPLFFANGTALVIILALFFVMAIGFRVLVGWLQPRRQPFPGRASAAGGSGFGEGCLARLYDSGWVRSCTRSRPSSSAWR